MTIHPDRVTGKAHREVLGINLGPGDKARILDPETLRLVRKLHLRSIRFPYGCTADQYNWQDRSEGRVNVEDFLDFCDAINAEPYYTINMQGGTEGLDGPVPDSLDEKIKYKHRAPNPCGNTDYHFGTLAEARALVEEFTVKRALSGKRPILCYEVGNENWGQAKTDWTFDVYARTIEVYAMAMRKVVEDASKTDSKLKDLKLHITAVGFPMNGNNQENPNTLDYNINVMWTAALNDLHGRGIIDAVQEHFYPYGSADGASLAWVNHNLQNILDARLGQPNPRLNGYQDPKLTYTMPLEFTEWNLKCWGTPWTIEKSLVNPGFESGLSGWETTSNENVTVSASAGRRGNGLIVKSSDGDFCEVSQRIERGDFANAPIGVWMRTSTPTNVQAFVRDSTGNRLGKPVSPTNPGMWQRLVVGSNLGNENSFELVLRVEGNTIAHFDEITLYSMKTTTGLRPPSCETYEQQLFCVDALRILLQSGAQRTHLHHLFGTYPCGLINADGTPRENYRAFELFAGFVGDELVETECKSSTYRFDTKISLATDFNGFPPTVPAVPSFSALASRTATHLFLLMINRLPDRSIEAEIDLGLTPLSPGTIRVLSGADIDLPGCNLQEDQIPVARRFKHALGSYSAGILAVRLK